MDVNIKNAIMRQFSWNVMIQSHKFITVLDPYLKLKIDNAYMAYFYKSSRYWRDLKKIQKDAMTGCVSRKAVMFVENEIQRISKLFNSI